MSTKATPDPRNAPQPFHQWLAGHVRGTFDDQLTFEMAELVRAVKVLDKKGTLTVTFTVAPAGSGGQTVFVAGEVKAKPPIAAPELAMFYTDENGRLHKEDPTAIRIPGVAYADADGALVKVDPETGEVVPATGGESSRG